MSLNLKKLDNRIIFLIIPLVLASFTHLWNASQFPSFHPDEGVYIRRALHILSGLGPQDPASRYDHSQESTSAYDHPYFGQLFLAGVFKILGYPQNWNTTPSVESIETLSSVPRIIMGVMAVIDTFLVYRISERRYNSKIALFAAVLFAVMPLSWFTRRIVLDSIMLPFLLTSILLTLEIRSNPKYVQILSVLSGTCLGLAIFTKIPAFTLIPLMVYLIYQNIDRKRLTSVNTLKILTIWLLPVILIPTIWPVYAFLSGDLNEWIDGISWQSSERQNKGKSLFDTMSSIWESDPVLLVLGAAGSIYLTMRRDYLPIIWIIPYISLLFLVGWVTHFHFILIIPILCISTAKMIYDLPAIVRIKKNIPISTIIISAIGLFGLISSAILISTNLSYVQFAATAYISNELVPNNESFTTSNHTKLNQIHTNDYDTNQITIVSSPIFSWVYKYVFNHNNTFAHVRDTQPIKTEKLILLVDATYRHVITGEEGENATQLNRLMNMYNSTEVVAIFKDEPSNYDKKNYPFTGIDSANIGSRTQEVRTNR